MVVIVYTKIADPYSIRACSLLRMKEVQYVEKRVPEYREEMERRTGSTRVPQVIIHGKAIGGFDQLGSLELKGELDALLVDPEALSKTTK